MWAAPTFFLEFDFVQVSPWKLPRWEEILCSSETVPKCKNFFASVKQIDDTLHCIALLHHLLKGRAGTWQKCNFSISRDVFKCFVNTSEAKLWWRHGGFERRTRRYVRLLHLWGQWQTTKLVNQKKQIRIKSMGPSIYYVMQIWGPLRHLPLM